MARELFIYWHLASAGDAAEVLAAAQQLQQQLRLRLPGLQARLYRRSDAAAGAFTVMETYALRGGLGPAQQALIVQAGDEALTRWCAGGQRHVEGFEPWG
jgi:hypothetical protein